MKEPNSKEKYVLIGVKEVLMRYEKMGFLKWWRISTTGRVFGNGANRTLIPNKEMAGFSDILILPRNLPPIFLEVKSSIGKITNLQLKFKQSVESMGHTYALVRSHQELDKIMNELFGNTK